MRATWLANVLRLAGLTVIEQEGWQQRGKELLSIEGVVLHHTATNLKWTDSSVGKLLRDGRKDLPGPLAQLGLDRQGRFWLIASGRCNHNGYGEWGNQSIGIEAFNDGKGEPWPDEQLAAWWMGTAAILRHLDLPPSRALGHRETDPQRKPDPVGVDLPAFRRQVAQLLHPEDDMTPAQDARLTDVERKVDEIHAALFTGAPGYGVAPINVAVNDIHFATAGLDLPARPSLLRKIAAKVGVPKQ